MEEIKNSNKTIVSFRTIKQEDGQRFFYYPTQLISDLYRNQIRYDQRPLLARINLDKDNERILHSKFEYLKDEKRLFDRAKEWPENRQLYRKYQTKVVFHKLTIEYLLKLITHIYYDGQQFPLSSDDITPDFSFGEIVDYIFQLEPGISKMFDKIHEEMYPTLTIQDLMGVKTSKGN